MTDDHGKLRQFAGQRRQRLGTCGIEIRPQQQVFRRITAQREFGSQHDVRPLRLGATGEVDDSSRIAGDIADHGIHLGNGYLEWHRRNYKR
jgi:hypothetical protein